MEASGLNAYVWTFDPFELIPIAVVAGAYAKRVHTLSSRDRPVAWWRPFLFYSGLLVVLIAVVTPIDHIGEAELFSVHMLQHVLLGDLAPLLIVAGLTGPILRPLLALPVLGQLRILAHPFVALPLWTINLYLWHIPPLYEAAVEYSAVHALEHISFFFFGAIMWAAILEPLPGPEWFSTGWKLLYIGVVRLAEALLANVFIWSGSALYSVYDDADELWGVGPVQDVNLGGIVMLGYGGLITLGAFCWLFLRWAEESEQRQQLIERGVDEATAARAVRYGRADELFKDLPPPEFPTAATR